METSNASIRGTLCGAGVSGEIYWLSAPFELRLHIVLNHGFVALR